MAARTVCEWLALALVLTSALISGTAAGISAATPSAALAPAGDGRFTPALPAELDLYLDVVVNGVATRLIAHVRQTRVGPTAGHLLIEPDALRNIGLLVQAAALREDGWVDLMRLAGVASRYDEATQTLSVQAADAAMIVRVFDAQHGGGSAAATGAAAASPRTPPPFGAFINHTLYADSGGRSGGNRWSGLGRTQTVSGLFEANLYGRFGTLTSTQLLNLNRNAGQSTSPRRFRSTRLDTQWAWFDEDQLTTLAAGDFIGSSLSWSRVGRPKFDARQFWPLELGF